MINKKKQDRLSKIFLSFFSVLLISFCVSILVKGELNYSNYWGGVLFAPIGIIVGFLILYIIWFKWKVVEKNKDAFKPKSKMDDYQKW